MTFILELEDWEELKSVSKKFDLLCLIKETAETQIHRLVGAKYKSDHISETLIDFNIAKAMNGVEKLKEYLGGAKPPAPEFYQKMLQLYAENGVTVWYAKKE